MSISIKLDPVKVKHAMTRLLLGKPGSMIAICVEDASHISEFKLGSVVTINHTGKRLSVLVGCLVSHIETRKLWAITYLQSMK